MENSSLKKKQVALDFDGVIANTFHFHLGKLKEVFGVELAPEDYKDIHNGNFYANNHPELDGLDYQIYAREVGESEAFTTPFPDAIDSIKSLSDAYQLHLVTSGWEMQVRPFLEKHGIVDLFSSLLFADQSTSKHEKLESILKSHDELTSEDCIFVTDTVGDVYESRAVQIPVIAVTFGFHEKARLVEVEPEYLADSWQEIVKIIDQHF